MRTFPGEIVLIDLAKCQQIWKYQTNLQSGALILSADGASILFTDDKLCLVSVELSSLATKKLLKFEIQPRCLQLSSKQPLRFTGGDDIQLYDLEKQALVASLHSSAGPVSSILLLQQESSLAAACLSGELIFFDVATRQPITKIVPHNAPINQMATVSDTIYSVSDDGLLAIVSLDHLLRDPVRSRGRN